MTSDSRDRFATIKDKGYLEKYAGSKKKLVAVGVNFSTEEKKINEWVVG